MYLYYFYQNWEQKWLYTTTKKFVHLKFVLFNNVWIWYSEFIKPKICVSFQSSIV